MADTIISYNQSGITFTNSISVVNEVHPNVRAWVNNGGDADSKTFDSISKFFQELDRNNVTYGTNGTLKRVNLCCGNSLTQALVPQLFTSGYGNSSDVDGGSLTYNISNGINTSGTHLDTTVSEDMFTEFDISLGIAFVNTNGTTYGCVFGTSAHTNLQSFGFPGPPNGYINFTAGSSNAAQGSTILNSGEYNTVIGSSRSSTDRELYINGVSDGSNTSATTAGLDTRNIYVGFSHSVYSTMDSRGYFIGEGISDSEALVIHNALNNFNTRLGRK